MNEFKRYLRSSIGRKQIVALTGAALVLFIFSHLAGNFLIFWGPSAFNGYTEKLHSFGLLLNLIEILLAGVFVVHIVFTFLLVRDNRRARPFPYEVSKPSKTRNFATQAMPFTGGLIFIFLFVHLWDFALADPNAAASVIDHVNYGLYGLVVNSFLNPVRSFFYVAVMVALGLHLRHAIRSVFQTFGWYQEKTNAILEQGSIAIAIIVAAGFSSIPLYVLWWIG
jgi:succinate dehydrogenase / fumarate reductase cytochrome b subunit